MRGKRGRWGERKWDYGRKGKGRGECMEERGRLEIWLEWLMRGKIKEGKGKARGEEVGQGREGKGRRTCMEVRESEEVWLEWLMRGKRKRE